MNRKLSLALCAALVLSGSAVAALPAAAATSTPAPTTLTYTGDTSAPPNTSYRMAAQLVSSVPACYQNQPVSFVINDAPIGIGFGPILTDTDGKVAATVDTSLARVHPKLFSLGTYLITAVYDGTPTCARASTQITFTVTAAPTATAAPATAKPRPTGKLPDTFAAPQTIASPPSPLGVFLLWLLAFALLIAWRSRRLLAALRSRR